MGKMKNKVFNYFQDLHKTRLPKKHSGTFAFDKRIVKCAGLPIQTVQKFNIDQTPYFLKDWDRLSSVQTIAASKMYNDIGIPTPPVYLMSTESGHGANKRESLKLVAQDILSISGEDLQIKEASQVVMPVIEKTMLRNYTGAQDRWYVLKNPHWLEAFLEVMTPECLKQVFDMYLADEIRTDNDRHPGNYFLYRSKNSKEGKYEGVIAIDLDNVIVFKHKPLTSDTNFQKFLSSKYPSWSPHKTITTASYLERIATLKGLIHNNALFNQNVETLKNVLLYDFPQTIKDVSSNPDLQKYQAEAYEAYSRLWEYARKELGRELGL